RRGAVAPACDRRDGADAARELPRTAVRTRLAAVWSKLLGLDPATAARLDPTRVFFVQPWPLWLTAAALLVVAIWTAFLYRKEGQRASAFYKGFLVLLRVAAVATLLFLIFQPMLRLQRVDVTPSNVVVLIDRSASMRLHDRWSDSRARAQLIRAAGTA